MKMRTCNPPGCADSADYLATPDGLPFRNLNLTQVGVGGDQSGPVINENNVAAVEELLGYSDDTGGRGLDEIALFPIQVSTGMSATRFAV